MATIPLFNTDGKEIGTLPLPDSIFGVAFNEALVHQAIVAEEANQRQGTHDVKQRSEVRGGGRKPWRQKGTGRARQGTIRAPHWRGGGVAFGPTPRDHRKAFPVKMRRGAMRCVLSDKVATEGLIGLESLDLRSPDGKPKTKLAISLLRALGLATTRRVLFVVPEYDQSLVRSVRNLPGIELRYAPSVSVRDVVTAYKVVIVKDALAKIAAVWTPANATEQAAEEVQA